MTEMVVRIIFDHNCIGEAIDKLLKEEAASFRLHEAMSRCPYFLFNRKLLQYL